MTNAVARELTLTWTLDAPPADVFRAWTEPAELGWFYNDSEPAPDEPIEVDLRVGGVWRQRMVESPERSYVTGGVYREIVPCVRLAFSWGAVGGWPALDPQKPEDSPLVTLTFAEADGGRTELTLVMELPAGIADAEAERWWSIGVRDGWLATVGRLVGSR